MRKTAGVLVIILGLVSAFLIASFAFQGFYLFAWLGVIIFWIPSIVCSVFVFRAKFWVACLVLSVLFGGIIPAIFIILARKDWGKDISVKKAVSVLLAILNIIAFMILAAFYYIIFVVQWGNTTSAIKWGLPLAVISIFALGVGILALRRLNWKLGIAGICLAIITIPYTNILLNSYSYVLLPQEALINSIQSPENEIIKQLILGDVSYTKCLNKGDYIVVDSDTISFSKYVDSEIFKDVSDKYNYDFTSLYYQLIKRNKDSIQMQINSSIKDGYYIDYENIFPKNKTDDFYGWPNWHTFRPQMVEYMILAYPAYDPEGGYVLTYVRHDVYSTGDISIYRYIDGKLTFLEQLIVFFYGPPVY